MRQFQAPRTMTPDELGDSLARLVWESFTDFVSDGDADIAFSELGVEGEEGMPDAHASEEALIFLMWAHTRGAQLAFVQRSPDDLVREGLDALHRAIFEDMVQHGTPRAHLPIFEQRVGARYSEYHRAAQQSDQALGSAVVRHLVRKKERPDQDLARAVSERALAVASPLRDFLEEVDLVEP